MKKNKLTVWQSACIITGYGVGGGIMAMPYLAEKNGILMALAILVLSFIVNLIIHLMIADISIKSGGKSQIVEVFSKYLFTGKYQKPVTLLFFVIMALVMFTNLAAYISGAAEIISDLIGVPMLVSKLIFYIVAAIVVLFGLKAVGLSETVAVSVIFAVVGVLGVFSLFNINNPLYFGIGKPNHILAFFGMAMLAFSAFFSVPQAVKGLEADAKKVKKAVFLGLMNNLILMVVITVCALLSSTEITEVAMIGWSKGIGSWAQIAGSVFTVLAMITSYWAISLALADITEEQIKKDKRICWLIATLPSLLMTFLNLGGFMEFMRIGGGLIGILIAILVIPAYRKSLKEEGDSTLGNKCGTALQILIVIAQLLMAVGNVVPV
ncbi:MAG: hypothetical protein IJB93_05685 [Clostridia bacterium]|nr:hypothetical protein [Clostridia bacterium]